MAGKCRILLQWCLHTSDSSGTPSPEGQEGVYMKGNLARKYFCAAVTSAVESTVWPVGLLTNCSGQSTVVATDSTDAVCNGPAPLSAAESNAWSACAAAASVNVRSGSAERCRNRRSTLIDASRGAAGYSSATAAIGSPSLGGVDHVARRNSSSSSSWCWLGHRWWWCCSWVDRLAAAVPGLVAML